MKNNIKNSLIVSFLTIAFISTSIDSFGTVTVCKIAGGPNGYKTVTEGNTPRPGGGNAYTLDCQDPGDKSCKWTTYSPGPGDYSINRVDQLITFADLQIAQGNANSNFLFEDAYLRITTTATPGEVIIRIYTIQEATALGLL